MWCVDFQVQSWILVSSNAGSELGSRVLNCPERLISNEPYWINLCPQQTLSRAEGDIPKTTCYVAAAATNPPAPEIARLESSI